MAASLALNAIVSGTIAGMVATSVTVAIEKWGGVIGGILGATPTTIIPASIGLAIESESMEHFVASMYTVPFGMLLNSFYLMMWRRFPRYLSTERPHRLAKMIALTSVAWLCMALGYIFGMVALLDTGFKYQGVLAVCALIGQLSIGAYSVLYRPLPAPAGKNKVNKTTLLLRASLGVCVVSSAVCLAKVNEVFAGLAASFPAIFMTSMVSLWISQGETCALGAAGPLVFGSSTVSFYAIAIGFLRPKIAHSVDSFAGALAISVVVSYIASVSCISIPIFLILRHRKAVDAQRGGYRKFSGVDEVHVEMAEQHGGPVEKNGGPSATNAHALLREGTHTMGIVDGSSVHAEVEEEHGKGATPGQSRRVRRKGADTEALLAESGDV